MEFMYCSARYKVDGENIFKFVDGEYVPVENYIPTIDSKLIEPAKILDSLTDEERLTLFSFYCKHCGCNNPNCQCWNDE